MKIIRDELLIASFKLFISVNYEKAVLSRRIGHRAACPTSACRLLLIEMLDSAL